MATNISASTYTALVQADGRQWVHEVHTDIVGALHDVFYLAGAADNLATNLAAHATSLGAALQAGEIAGNIAAVETLGSLATPTFVYSAGAQNAAALRVAYASMTQTQAIMTGDYLNTLSAAAIESAFGITAAQEVALKPTLTNAASLAASIRAAAGQ